MAEVLPKTLETILVVDDVDLVLELVVEVLKTAKFNVLQARTGSEALEVAAHHPGKIDLLLSDVQMPGMTGPQLGETLKQLRPEIHVMFMSAFTGGNLLVLNYGWSFIEKPFVSKKLLEMVNDVLHSPNKSQSTHGYDTRKDTDPYKKIEAGQTPPAHGKAVKLNEKPSPPPLPPLTTTFALEDSCSKRNRAGARIIQGPVLNCIIFPQVQNLHVPFKLNFVQRLCHALFSKPANA
jgi:CheY-like chemotaxis protein